MAAVDLGAIDFRPHELTNSSGIRPMEYNVLVEPREVESQTKGGIYIPEDTREKEQYGQTEGVLVAMSPLAFNYDSLPDGYAPKVGDRVVFSRHQGNEVRGQDGKTYWLLKDKSIAGVLE